MARKWQSVTFGESHRSLRKTRGVCRDCSHPQPVDGKDWSQASPPRCGACGGMLDRNGLWPPGVKYVGKIDAKNIPYPSGQSEFEIHAWLLFALRDAGFDVRACVLSDSGTHAFDLVVFDANRVAVRIIEVKKGSVKKKFGKAALNGKRQQRHLENQVAAYGLYGIPVDSVIGMDGAEDYVRRVKSGELLVVPA